MLSPTLSLATCRSYETVRFRWEEQSNEIFSSDFLWMGFSEAPVSDNFFELAIIFLSTIF